MPFDDGRREDWHFIPKPQRKGLALKDMTPEQIHMAHVLLSASLSQRGYAKATTIMSLDALLKQIEQEAGFTQMLSLRDPLFYYVTIFGEPAPGAEWGGSRRPSRLGELPLVGNRVASSPTFLGSIRTSPRRAARRPADPRTRGGARPSAGGVARRRQRAKAILSDVAPNDIVTAAERIVRSRRAAQGTGVDGNDTDQQRRCAR